MNKVPGCWVHCKRGSLMAHLLPYFTLLANKMESELSFFFPKEIENFQQDRGQGEHKVPTSCFLLMREEETSSSEHSRSSHLNYCSCLLGSRTLSWLYFVLFCFLFLNRFGPCRFFTHGEFGVKRETGHFLKIVVISSWDHS